jgi:TPR repeat protein
MINTSITFKLRALVFFTILASVFTHNPAAADGMAAFARKDYNEAYRIWSRNPDTAEANYGIGRIVLEGLGSAPRNPEKGLSLIQRAASANYRPALMYLADYYERTGNSHQAIKFLDRLSDNKDLAIEQRILSLLTKVVKGEPTSSAKFCETNVNISKLGGQVKQIDTALCAMNGHPSSQTKDDAIGLLATMASDAYSKMEYVEAQRLWSLLPEGPESLYGLGVLSLKGLPGTRKNVEKGIALLERSSNSGYKEASRELARHYAQVGDNEKAIAILRKTCDSSDQSCNKTLVDLLSKSNITLNKEYCERLEGARYPEESPQYINYLTCAFSGFSAEVGKEEAAARLKSQLRKNPTMQSFAQLAPHLLNRNSSIYSLQDFEKVVWSLDPELKNQEIRAVAKSSGITDELISDMPNFTEQQKVEKMSANFVAALGGNGKKAIVVGRQYSTNAIVDKSFSTKAKAILGLLESEKETVEYKKITANILRADVKYGEHLKVLFDLLKTEKKDEKFIQEQFSFQFGAASSFLTYNEPVYRLDEVNMLAQVVASSNILEVQSTGLPILLKLESKYRSTLDRNDEVEFFVKSEKLEKIVLLCKEIQKKLPPSKKTTSEPRPPESAEKLLDSQLRPEGDSGSTVRKNERNGTLEKKKLANEYSKYRYECDQSSGPGCTKAAEILLAGEVPDDLRNLSLQERKEAAIRMLDRANNLKDLAGTTLLYDLLNAERNPDARQKADSLLKQPFFVSVVAGQIRRYERDLKFDPIRTPASILMDKKSIQAKCDEVSKLASESLNERDMKIAIGIIDGFTCSSLRKIQ